jgi:hypothetical protein
MTTKITIEKVETSFKVFLFEDKTNKRILWLVAAAIVVQFAIFKYLYPFASYIHGDSFSYIKAAAQNLDINTYPIGYSRFLRLFNVFTKSDTALVAFQYLFIQASTLFLLFTIFYFYRPGKVTQYILLVFMALNPLFLHLANLVSSDCLFVGLSLTWFGLLLWITHEPSNKVIIWHTVILFIAFTVRYNAIVYPLITTLAFSISGLPLRKKITGVLAAILLCGLFVCFTSYRYKKLTGYWQFSPFTGWLMTNNAMYAFRYVEKTDRKPIPQKFQRLDSMVREYFDSTHRNYLRYPVEAYKASTAYMWSPGLTMFKYREQVFRKDTSTSEFKKWASMGPIYKEYGIYMIRSYPLHFARYYLWPNIMKYYAPPVEFLGEYNSGKDKVAKEAQMWFEYKSLNVYTRMKNKKVQILDFYPILSGILNLVMFFLLIFYCLLKGWENNIINKGIVLGSSMWLINAGFTISVSSAALRFQSFPVIFTTILVTMLVDWMIHLMRSMDEKVVSTVNIRGKNQEELISDAII